MSVSVSKFLFIKNDRTPTILNLSSVKKFFAVFILLVCFSFSFGSEESSKPFPAKSVEDAVFQMDFFSPDGDRLGSGTAFVVELKKKLYLVTSFHVVDPLFQGQKISWKITNKKGLVINKEDIEGLAGLSRLYDLAVFKIKKKKNKVPVLRADNGRENSDIAYVMGFPNGQYEKIRLNHISEVSPAHLSGIRSDSLGNYDPALSPLLTSNREFNINGGLSGGPVFNDKGRVIGIVAQSSPLGIDVEFVKFQFVKDTLRANNSLHKDMTTWAKWVEKETKSVFELADKGDSFAQFVLAHHAYHLYLSSEGDPLKEGFISLALKYMKESAAQGNYGSQLLLGGIYLDGTPSNPPEGIKLLRLAASRKKSIRADLILALALVSPPLENSEMNRKEGRNLLRELDQKGVKLASHFLEMVESRNKKWLLDDKLIKSTERRDDGCTNGLFH